MSDLDIVHYQRKKELGWITLNRPQALNALNKDVLRQLAAILDEVRTDDAVKP